MEHRGYTGLEFMGGFSLLAGALWLVGALLLGGLILIGVGRVDGTAAPAANQTPVAASPAPQ